MSAAGNTPVLARLRMPIVLPRRACPSSTNRPSWRVP